MSNEVTTYPVVYNPEIKALHDLKNIDFGLDVNMPTIDEIQKEAGITENSESKLIQSGILQGLHKAITLSENDFHKVTYPSWTDDININNMIKEDIEDYFKKRVFSQTIVLCDFIDGLIMLDRYPQKMFGHYKQLKNFIFATSDTNERVRALNQLRIIASSIIPPDIKFEKVELVEPNLLATAPTKYG